MKVNKITLDLKDTLKYDDQSWFSDQEYIISVIDPYHERNIIPIIFNKNNKLIELYPDDFDNKIKTVTNHSKVDKPLKRFVPNQLIALNYGNLIQDYNENERKPKIKTYNENINPIVTNKIFEFFEGELNIEKSLFKPTSNTKYELIKDHIKESEESFFIINNNQLLGPFKIIEVYDDLQFKIKTNGKEFKFGEYYYNDKSYLEFEVNRVNRKIFIKKCKDLELNFKNIFDFTSNDDLISEFNSDIKNNLAYFNKENLENTLSILKKTLEIDNFKIKYDNNDRLKKLIDKGIQVIEEDIKLFNYIPKVKELKTKESELNESIFEAQNKLEEEKNKIHKLENLKIELNNEIKKIEETKAEELEKQKNNLDNDIKELEKQKNNLNLEIQKEKEKLDKNLAETKKDIEFYDRSKNELIIHIEGLREDFKNEQNKAHNTLQNLIKSKVHFDFISGRDLSEQENKTKEYLDFKVINQFEEYKDLKKEIIRILKQNNRNFDSHFIDNLLISIFQNTLTVFAGVPGSGKTTLARFITKLLAPKEKIREVSVNRGWTSQKDFVGFMNPLTKKFHSSSTDVYSLLKQMDYEANNEQEYLNSPMSFIILDEANLSPLEHYWSSFYNLTDSTGMLELSLGHQEKVKFPNNLRFIGTINYDHTTEELSPRVLDRINIIQLENKDQDFNFNSISNTEIETLKISFQKCIDFFDLKSNDVNTENEDLILKDFNQIENQFKKLNILISPRVKISIKKYITIANPHMKHKNKPLDYCVAQRLLPLINLHGANYKQKLDVLKDLLQEKDCDISVKILNQIIKTGSDEQSIYQDNFNYFLTLSNV
ncbi:AAA family ATPase [Aureivirga marina]|uniref:AAA family ATPase n=1 Tax=Aureivirga marina TaxID=1182451 RepID=UPI0018CBDD75|nr:AAA family ATPase [Aureivirga marina]